MDWLHDRALDELRLERRLSAVEQVRLQRAMTRFTKSRQGDLAPSMARRLADGVRTGRLSREVVEQFSKWCALGDEGSSFVSSLDAAEELSHVLFGEIIPRMRDPDNRRVEDADQMWAALCHRLDRRRG